MSEMVPLPPEEEKSERPVWVIPLGIVSAVLVAVLGTYLAWDWLGGQSGRTPSFLSFLSRSPSSAQVVVLTPVMSSATATPHTEISSSTATPSPTEESPAATPTTAPTEESPAVTPTTTPTEESPAATPTTTPTETSFPTETASATKPTEQPSEDNGSEEMPATGFGTVHLAAVGMALAIVVVVARVVRTRYQT